MSAPASRHRAALRRAELVVERVHAPDSARCVKAVLALLAPRRAAAPGPPVHNGETADAPTSTASEPRLE